MSRLNQANEALGKMNEEIKMADIGIRNVINSLSQSVNPVNIIDNVAKISQNAARLNREAIGRGRQVSEALERLMANVTFSSMKYGISLEDNLRTMGAINTSMRNTTLLTEEQLLNLQILSRNANMSAESVGAIFEAFDTLGVGTESAISSIDNLESKARMYGINVSQYMDDITKNIKQLSLFNFKNGIDGFGNMLAKAQALRFDVQRTFDLTERLLDPEVAIETAAGFQMLGGAIGDLGDPFKLLHLAQNDAEGLQDAIIDMASSAVVFNEKTGDFDIPVTEMYRLREAAKLTGMSWQEFSDTALKASQRTRKLDILSVSGSFTDADKELIASMSQFEGGELKVVLPGKEGMGEFKSVTELNADDLKILSDLQKDASKSEKDIALEQTGKLELIYRELERIRLGGTIVGSNLDVVTDAFEITDVMAKNISEGLEKYINKEVSRGLNETINTSMLSMQGNQSLGISNLDIDDIFGSIDMIGDKFVDLTENILTDLSNNLSDSNVYKNSGLFNFLSDFKNLVNSEVNILNGNTNTNQKTNTQTTPLSIPLTSPTNSSNNQQNNNNNQNNNKTSKDIFEKVVNKVDVNNKVSGSINLNLNNKNKLINMNELSSQLLGNNDFISSIIEKVSEKNNVY